MEHGGGGIRRHCYWKLLSFILGNRIRFLVLFFLQYVESGAKDKASPGDLEHLSGNDSGSKGN